MADSEYSKKSGVHNGSFDFDVSMDKHNLTIIATHREECFQWIYVFAFIDANQMPEPFTPKIIFNIFDDYRRDELDKDTKIIFPDKYNEKYPMTIDIIHTVRFYRHVSEKKLTIILQSRPITSNERFRLKNFYFCRSVKDTMYCLWYGSSRQYKGPVSQNEVARAYKDINETCDKFTADIQQYIETDCKDETIANLKKINDSQEDKIKILEDQIKKINDSQEDKIKILEDQIKNLQSILDPMRDIAAKMNFLTNRSDTKIKIEPNVAGNLQEPIKNETEQLTIESVGKSIDDHRVHL